MNNRLTYRNGPGQHLLSTFRGSSQDVPPSSQKTRRASPDIHAAPLSSESDNEDNDNDGISDTDQLPQYSQEDVQSTTFKPTQVNDRQQRRTTSTRRSGRLSSSRSASIASSLSPQRRGAVVTRPNGVSSISPKRASITDGNEEDDDFEMFASSQSQKRGAKRVKAYGGVRLGGSSSTNAATTTRREGGDDNGGGNHFNSNSNTS